MNKLYDPYAEFETEVLPNGLTVHVLHRPNHPWVAAGMVVHSGFSCDSPDLTGVAHFVEHLVNGNVPDIPVSEIESFFTKLGGSVSLGTTSFLATKYKFFLPAEVDAVRRGCDLMGLMLFGDDLNVGLIERERKIILQEYRRSYQFDYEADWLRQIRESLYPGLPISKFLSGLGYPDHVVTAQGDDLRHFYQQWYTPSNASMVVVGGLRLSEIVAIVGRSELGRNKNGYRHDLPAPILDPPKPLNRRLTVHLGEYTNQAVDYFDIRYITILPGSFAGSVAAKIFTNALNQMMFEELRQSRHWTYSAGASSVNLASMVELHVFGNKINLAALPEIDQVVLNGVRKLFDDTEQFESIRRSRLSNLYLHDDSDRGICDSAIGDLIETHQIISLADEYEETASLSHDHFVELLGLLKPDRVLTLIEMP